MPDIEKYSFKEFPCPKCGEDLIILFMFSPFLSQYDNLPYEMICSKCRNKARAGKAATKDEAILYWKFYSTYGDKKERS